MVRTCIDIGCLSDALEKVGEDSEFVYATGSIPYTDEDLGSFLHEAKESFLETSSKADRLDAADPCSRKISEMLDTEAGILIRIEPLIGSTCLFDPQRTILSSTLLMIGRINTEIMEVIDGLTSGSETDVLDECNEVLMLQRRSIVDLAFAL